MEGRRQTWDVRFPGLHPQLWAEPERQFYRAPRNGGQTTEGEAEGSQTATPETDACADRGNGEMASIRRTGLLQLPCSTGQRQAVASVSRWDQASVVARTSPPRAAASLVLGTTGTVRQTMASIATHSSSLSECSL